MMWLLRIILVIIFSAIGSTVLVLGGLYIGYIIIKLRLGGKKSILKNFLIIQVYWNGYLE